MKSHLNGQACGSGKRHRDNVSGRRSSCPSLSLSLSLGLGLGSCRVTGRSRHSGSCGRRINGLFPWISSTSTSPRVELVLGSSEKSNEDLSQRQARAR